MLSVARRTTRKTDVPPLVNGDHLDQKTFHERYEARPEVRAELIGDRVHEFARIRPSVPPAFRELLEVYALHGARVIRTQNECGGRTFAMELVPVSHDGRPLVLTYYLASDSEAHTTLPPSEQCFWLYDEVEGPDANAGVFTHTILLSDGTEVCLRFTDFNLGSLACNRDDDSALSR